MVDVFLLTYSIDWGTMDTGEVDSDHETITQGEVRSTRKMADRDKRFETAEASPLVTIW